MQSFIYSVYKRVKIFFVLCGSIPIINEDTLYSGFNLDCKGNKILDEKRQPFSSERQISKEAIVTAKVVPRPVIFLSGSTTARPGRRGVVLT